MGSGGAVPGTCAAARTRADVSPGIRARTDASAWTPVGAGVRARGRAVHGVRAARLIRPRSGEGGGGRFEGLEFDAGG